MPQRTCRRISIKNRNVPPPRAAGRSADPPGECAQICIRVRATYEQPPRVKGQQGIALGFAANHTGLVLCPAVLGLVERVRPVATDATHPVRPLMAGSMLQAVWIDQPTHGLIPAYGIPEPGLGEKSFAFDREGTQVPPTLCDISADIRIRLPEGDSVWLDDAFGASFPPGRELLGGPVLTRRSEVIGTGVVSSPLARILFVQPWSSLASCVRMDWSSPPGSPA